MKLRVKVPKYISSLKLMKASGKVINVIKKEVSRTAKSPDTADLA